MVVWFTFVVTKETILQEQTLNNNFNKVYVRINLQEHISTHYKVSFILINASNTKYDNI